LILSNGKTLTFPDVQNNKTVGTDFHYPIQSQGLLNLDAIMIPHIKNALEMAGGKVNGKAGAANLLNTNPSTLRKRMRKRVYDLAGNE
jgi:hypothetical protein